METLIKHSTPAQRTAIMTLVRRMGLDKEEIVDAATNGRTTSLRETTKEEARQLLEKLGAQPKHDNRLEMIKKIYSLAHQMRWTLPNQPDKVDVQNMNERLVKYGYLHKPLDKYTYNELPKLVTQVEQMLTHYLTGK